MHVFLGTVTAGVPGRDVVNVKVVVLRLRLGVYI